MRQRYRVREREWHSKGERERERSKEGGSILEVKTKNKSDRQTVKGERL